MTPGIRVGQRWQDNDKRSRNRVIEITNVDATHVDAKIVSDDLGPQRIGRNTRIARARMKPTSTGYRLIADTPDWEPVLLDERHEWWGIRHIPTTQCIARWDGTPARWTSKALAEEDVAALGRGETATQSLDILAATGFWACPEPDCTTPHSEPGDCPDHEIPLIEVGADGFEVTT